MPSLVGEGGRGERKPLDDEESDLHETRCVVYLEMRMEKLGAGDGEGSQEYFF